MADSSSRSLGRQIFNTVFSCIDIVGCISHPLTSFEKRDEVVFVEGVVVALRKTGSTEKVWIGQAGSGPIKTQLVINTLESLLEKLRAETGRTIIDLKTDWIQVALPEQVSQLASSVGNKILEMCKRLGSIELDLGLRGDVFFKASCWEELMLKVDLAAGVERDL